MARMPRIVVPGYPHHVTQRGNRRQRTFFHEDDYRYYVELLGQFSQQAGTEIWAWCLMPNHYHLALRTGAVTRWAYRGAEMKQESEEFSAAYEKLDRELALWHSGSR